MTASEQLSFDILARDAASPAFAKLAGAADQAGRNVRQVGETLAAVGKMRAVPVLAVDDKAAQAKLDAVRAKLAALSGTAAQARVGVTDKDALAKLAAAGVKLDALGRKTADPRITVEGAARAEAQLLAVDAAMDKLNLDLARAGSGAPLLASLEKLKSRMAQLGIADIADVNVQPGKIQNQLQLLKRMFSQAGLSDVLDVNIGHAGIAAQVRRLANVTETIPVSFAIAGGLPKLPSGGATEDISAEVTGTDAVKALAAATDQLLAEMGKAQGGTRLFTDAIAAGTPLWSGAGGAVGFLQGHVQLFGGALTSVGIPAILSAASGLHLVTEAVAETSGTLIPAAVAFGAFGVAAIPTIKDLYSQLQSIYQVNQAFGASIYPLTGGFARMAAAVRPEVYTLFGEALVFAGHSTGALSQLAAGAGKVIDDLGARFVYATTQGSGFSAFVSKATSDLAGWGNLTGNISGIIGNLLKVVPAYAGDILAVLNGVTHAIETVTGSGLGQWLLSVGLAAHGALLYIGLLGTGFAKLASAGLSGLSSLLLNAGTGLEKLGPAGEKAAGGMLNLAAGAEQAAALPWGWISLAAAAVGILAYKLVTSKDAIQQLGASIQQNLQSASLTTLPQQLGTAYAQVAADLSRASAEVTQFAKVNAEALQQASEGLSGHGTAPTPVEQEYTRLKQNAADYGAVLGTVKTDQATVNAHIAQAAAIFGSTKAAWAALTAAGITSAQFLDRNKQDWAEAEIEAKAYDDTLRVLTQTSGAYGAAQNALNFAAGNTANQLGQIASVIGKAVQAEDQQLAVITGSRTALDAFEQGFAGLGTSLLAVAGMTGNSTKVFDGLAGSAAKVGAAMAGTSQASYALNAAWYAQLQNGQKLIDALRTEGASASDLQTVVATTASQMLGFAGTSTEARSVIVALINNALGPGTVSLQNLNKWVGSNSTSLAGMNTIIGKVIAGASQLAGVLQANLNQMLAQAAASAYGGQKALDTFSAAVLNGNTSAQQLVANGGQKVLAMFLQMYQQSVPQAEKAFTDFAENGLGFSQAKAQNLWNTLVRQKLTEAGTQAGETKANFVKLAGQLGLTKTAADQLWGSLHKVAAGSPYKATLTETGLGQYTIKAVGQQITGTIGAKAGGLITGGSGPTADDVPVAASAGEYFIKAASVAHYGIPAMAAVNAGKAVIGYAAGGQVPGYSGPMSGLAGATAADWNTFRSDVTAATESATTAATKSAMAAASAASPLAGITGVPSVAAFSSSAAVAQAFAKSILWAYGWGLGQFPPLVSLWNRESGWRWNALNPSSGAYGIPQALPADKMASAGADWRTNYQTQIRWGLPYIEGVYGSPSGAWAHEVAFNWYGSGTGSARAGLAVVGERGPELIRFRGGEQVLPASAAGIKVSFEIASSGNAGFDQFMLKWIRENVRVKGGGSVQAAFGRN